MIPRKSLKFTKNIFVDSVFDNFVTSSVEVVSFNKFIIEIYGIMEVDVI